MENYDINCEFCRAVINTEESFKVKIDESGGYLDICESCYEGSIV